MSIEKRSKLNQLMLKWPDGKIYSSKWLKNEGYGANFTQKYKSNKWIESIGSGAFKKFGDKITWVAALECLQQQLKKEIYVGAKTALELSGRAQYLKLKESSVVLLSNKKEFLPTWMKKYNWSIDLDFRVNHLFSLDIRFGEKLSGFTRLEVDRSLIITSAPERAYLEFLDDLPDKASYSEAKEIMENLISIRPDVIQILLESCTSFKVKRLFLHFAEKVNHSWFKKLDLREIKLGSGKRVIFQNGILDKKYNITVPKDENNEAI